jgi:hypothetical protein
VACTLLAACGGVGRAELDGTGGDAWTFEKPVSGAIDGACDSVIVSGGRHEVLGELDDHGFTARVPLSAGDNEVTARCYLGARSDPQTWRVRLEDRPRAVARATIVDGRIRLDADASARSPVADARFATVTWRMRDGPALGDGRVITIDPPAADGRHVVDLEIVDERGARDRAAVAFEIAAGAPRVVGVDEPPPWLEGAVVYGVFPFFFGPRGLPDVTDRLDDLADLGVNVLWLSPVTAAADGDYGYAVTDHFTVRDDFGGRGALDDLLDAAHARGMRVILDLVANHTSLDHPYVTTRPEFYERDDSGELEHYFDWEHLPNLDHSHREVRAWLKAAFAEWVRAGVDGFRADASWGVTERTPDFWPALRAELHRIDPDILLIAESSARDPRSYDGFDLAYDWTDELGEWAWRDAFDQSSPERLAAALSAETGPTLRFLDNNDTGPRFATRYGADRVAASAAILFTVPGVPALWTGSETGAALDPYAEGPALDWSDPDGLVSVYQRLIAIHATLSGDLLLLESNDILAYLRGDVLVIVDLAGNPVDVDLPITPDLATILADGLHDIFHDEPVPHSTPNGRLRLSLPDDGLRILR